ncbi:MAG: phosphonate ABC transporter, permease protein PhnE [Pikeienuella sp.]
MDAAELARLEAAYPEAIRPNWRRRGLLVGGIFVLIGYLVWLWFAFDVAGALDRARLDRAQLLALDIYAHKVHVEVDPRAPLEITAKQENSRFHVYDPLPEWVTGADGRFGVDLGEHGRVEIVPGLVTVIDSDGLATRIRTGNGERRNPEVVGADRAYLEIRERRVPMLDEDGAPVLNLAGEPRTRRDFQYVEIDGGRETLLADKPAGVWLEAARNKIEIRLGLYARMTITSTKVEILRYFRGWENFWFPFGHPLNGASFGEVWAAGFGDAPISDEQRPEQSNWDYIWEVILTNPDWQHGEVWEAMWLTVLMALLGTMLASIFGLPLAFLAAKNVNPIVPLRLAVKKFLDFLRAVDMLIWSLIFIRAFGQGPLSGVLAIAVTDTGTLGKLYSEAIENADRKQVEGTASVGAGAIQRNFFGIVPQVLPVFVSQALYFFESNTRSATIIGILGAGGIGLKLADAMRTGQDWENTMYIIVLIILVVIAMDNISAWARRRIISGPQPELETWLARRGEAVAR